MNPGFHADVLPPAQVRVLRALSTPVDARGFYMGGGTALALHLGHRRSIDFDWFREAPIPDPLLLATDFKSDVPELAITGSSVDTLHGELEGVQLSWFTYHYPLLEPLVMCSEFGCRLSSIRDLAAMKLAAISQRGAKKDFFDLVAIEHAGIALDAMLAAYRAKFSIDDVGHVLMSLTWFEEADDDPSPILASKTDWDSVKATIVRWVKSL